MGFIVVALLVSPDYRKIYFNTLGVVVFFSPATHLISWFRTIKGWIRDIFNLMALS